MRGPWKSDGMIRFHANSMPHAMRSPKPAQRTMRTRQLTHPANTFSLIQHLPVSLDDPGSWPTSALYRLCHEQAAARDRRRLPLPSTITERDRCGLDRGMDEHSNAQELCV